MKRIIIIAPLFVWGCGEPPPTPTLPGPSTSRVERLILDDEIDAKDIRQIFDALNSDGSLETLAPLIQESSDAELAKLGQILTDHFFQPAQDPKGFVGLLSQRVSRRGFSSLRAFMDRGSRPQGRSYGPLVETALRSKHLVDVVERTIGFLSPALDETLSVFETDLQQALEPFDAPVPAKAAPSRQIVADLGKLLELPAAKDRFGRLSDAFTARGTFTGVLEAIRQVNLDHDGHAFDGVGSGLSQMMRQAHHPETGASPSQLDSFMDLVLALNGPSDGLFSTIQAQLVENPDLKQQLGTAIQPNVPERFIDYIPVIPNRVFGSLVDSLRDTDADPPYDRKFWLNLAGANGPESAKEAFFLLFVAARTAAEKYKGVPKDLDADDYLLFNMPLYLNSYALAEWIQRAMHQNLSRLKKLPADRFLEALWLAHFPVDGFDFGFTAMDDAAGDSFDPGKIKDLDALGLSDFAAELSKASPHKNGNFNYHFEPVAKSVSFNDALRSSVLAVDSTRGYSDSSGLVRVVLDALTEKPKGGGKSHLENLETSNLLYSAHHALASMPLDTWKSLRSVAFDGIGIGNHSENRKFLTNFYKEGSDLAKKVSRILDAVDTLKALDSGGKSPSAFEAYLEILHLTGPRERKALSEAWVFLAESGLLGLESGADAKAEPRFPSIFNSFSASGASSIFKLASRVDPLKYQALADFFDTAMGTQKGIRGSDIHWDFLLELVGADPAGMTILIDSYRTGSLDHWRKELTADERTWAISFVQSGALRDLAGILRPRFSTALARGWNQELQKLLLKGILKSTFRLLELVRNDRLRAIAKTLQEWESSGELKVFLETFAPR